jgi:uncharacterized membrane protein YccC
MAPERALSGEDRLTLWDFCFAVSMAIACSLSYWISAHLIAPFVDQTDAFLAGMWAAVATVFVYRPTHTAALSAGWSRLVATCVSFALCLAYLLILPFHLVGLAVLLGAGTLVVIALGRRDDVITTGITTAVVLVVAGMGPPEVGWHQPLLRLIDTVIGIAVGVAGKWLASSLYDRIAAKQEQTPALFATSQLGGRDDSERAGE